MLWNLRQGNSRENKHAADWCVSEGMGEWKEDWDSGKDMECDKVLRQARVVKELKERQKRAYWVWSGHEVWLYSGNNGKVLSRSATESGMCFKKKGWLLVGSGLKGGEECRGTRNKATACVSWWWWWWFLCDLKLSVSTVFGLLDQV